MTSRQRVLAVFEHQLPDRVPMWCGASQEFWDKCKTQLKLDDEGLRRRFHDDFRRVLARYAGPPMVLQHKDAVSRTVFGVERHGMGYGQPLEHPLAGASVQQVHDYPWPDPDWMDVSHIRSEAAAWAGQYAILGGDWSPFFHDAIDLMGMEGLYLAMFDHPEVVDAMMTHMVDYYAGVSRRIFDAAADVIDVFFIANDLGSMTGPLLSAEMFKRFILPHTRRLIELGHEYGLYVQMHCCGGFAELIPLLVEAGLDALHSVQPSCRGMDLRTLKTLFGDRIVFNGAIDSHRVLIDGTPETVIRDTREVLDIMMGGGGYIGGASHDTILEETPVENVLAMFDTIEDYGVYEKA